MVLKNLIIFLVLLWTMHECMAKRSTKLNIDKQRRLIIDKKMTLQTSHRLVHQSNVMSIEQVMMEK